MAENKLSYYSLSLTIYGSDLQYIVRRYKRSNVAPLPSAYKAGCSQYLKFFVWVACHVNTRLKQKFMIPGLPYSGPYMIPGRSWQDHSMEICMISMVP